MNNLETVGSEKEFAPATIELNDEELNEVCGGLLADASAYNIDC
jgi:hypothetical protein